MTPHFQRSVVAAPLLPPLATAAQAGPPVGLPHSHYLPIVIQGSVGAGQLGGPAGLEGKLPALLSGDYRPNYCLPLNVDTHGAPVAHIVDKNQPLAVHPVAGVVASGGEVLLWTETAVPDSATFFSLILADASAALAAVASVAAAAPVAAAFVILTSGVQQCLQFDLQVQPGAAPGPGLRRQMALASALLYCVRGAAACPLMRGQRPPGRWLARLEIPPRPQAGHR